MKFYVAQTHGRCIVAEILRDYHDVVSTWDIEDQGYNPESAYRAARDIQQLKECDVFVVTLGSGANHHTELGMAMALGKIIIILDEPGNNIFARMYRNMSTEEFLKEFCHVKTITT